MPLKVSGLDELSKTLKEAQKAIRALDGDITEVTFDPHDPASIEAAISKVNTEIDLRIGQYASNPWVQPLIEEMKESYREQIIQRAAEARMKGDVDESSNQ